MTDEEVNVRAYERYEWRKNNNMPGNRDGDWFWAKRELAAEEMIRKYENEFKYVYYPRGGIR